MSSHTAAHYSSTPLKDVEMEDLSDITDALVAAIPSNQPNEAHEDVHLVDSISAIPLNATPSNAEDEASEQMHDVHNATSQTQQAPVPTQASDTTIDEDATSRLRFELFANMFASQTIDLKNFTLPAECTQYPGHADEILEAYLERTRLAVKIWINFDAAEEVFFEGARAEQCGRLQLPEKQLQWLLGLDRDRYNFNHVRLDIGTPFRTLVRFLLDVHYDDQGAYLELKAKMPKLRPPRELDTLRDFLETRVQMVNGAGVNRSLDMGDLVELAKLFRRYRHGDEDDGEWEEPRYGGGEWAGIEEPPLLLRSSRWAF